MLRRPRRRRLLRIPPRRNRRATLRILRSFPPATKTLPRLPPLIRLLDTRRSRRRCRGPMPPQTVPLLTVPCNLPISTNLRPRPPPTAPVRNPNGVRVLRHLFLPLLHTALRPPGIRSEALAHIMPRRSNHRRSNRPMRNNVRNPFSRSRPPIHPPPTRSIPPEKAQPLRLLYRTPRSISPLLRNLQCQVPLAVLLLPRIREIPLRLPRDLNHPVRIHYQTERQVHGWVRMLRLTPLLLQSTTPRVRTRGLTRYLDCSPWEQTEGKWRTVSARKPRSPPDLDRKVLRATLTTSHTIS
ncbi:hypothetical protein BDV59DRAFT_183550 [Aspergillus ambiguus]|uniref:uncharacterized protein n=1 Tax=Aspergillus ambiguus TaxID=176160 RepID=UPI003CCCD00C